ncbi:unnamed protein product [Linum tenue]|uniref:Replication factor C subunit 3 n=1 Tax=Linum tenue TaxID=586396 RepID=A0AAV0L0J2_9ROSI|nr:unnamed protein product [Linum tenue]
MEKYSTSCRLILCCNSSSKVTEAIRSRCLNVRINAPAQEQIVRVLDFIGKKEGLEVPPGFTARIAEKSNRSLRRAILSFETCRVQQYPFKNYQEISPLEWEEYVSTLSSDIMKEQSPKRLFEVRGKLYELLVNCIPPEILLKVHRMRLGQKAIFHLEGNFRSYILDSTILIIRGRGKQLPHFKFAASGAFLGWLFSDTGNIHRLILGR